MITFIQFLIESAHLTKDIHNNTSAMHLKRIAKASDRHGGDISAARFVIDKAGKLHGANATEFLHHDIVPSHDHYMTGAVGFNHRTQKHTYEIYQQSNPHADPGSHPVIKDMIAAGIKHHKGNYIL